MTEIIVYADDGICYCLGMKQTNSSQKHINAAVIALKTALIEQKKIMDAAYAETKVAARHSTEMTTELKKIDGLVDRGLGWVEMAMALDRATDEAYDAENDAEEAYFDVRSRYLDIKDAISNLRRSL